MEIIDGYFCLQRMRIAILGWGSLIWDPRGLPREGVWQKPGPILPLEFSRVSRDCRLTLVLDPEYGDLCETYFILSPRADLDDAIRDLRVREETRTSSIGFVDLERDRRNGRYAASIKAITGWATDSGFQGVVWTDLEGNFETETAKPFTVPNAVAYLGGLPATAKKNAMRYIRNAPEEISTPLRRGVVPSG